MSGASDVEQIRALVVAYAERLDAGDLDGVAALFERGEFRSARTGAALVGVAAVRMMYEPVVIYADGTPRTQHLLGNIEIDVDRDLDTATASCVFTVMQAASSGSLQAVLAGRYHDRFTLDGDRWWFTERVVHPDLLGDLARHTRSK